MGDCIKLLPNMYSSDVMSLMLHRWSELDDCIDTTRGVHIVVLKS